MSSDPSDTPADAMPVVPDLATLQELEARSLVGTYVRQPVVFVSGEGCVLRDADGAEYLDMLAGISVSNVGHCHPHVVQALRRQAGELIHVSNLFYTAPALQLADRLARGSLGGKVFFTNSGAEANEAAIKLARRAVPAGGFVVVSGGFHGRTYGALSATPQESKQAPFAPLVPGFRVVPPDAAAVRAAVTPGTAGVLIEPIQGESGIHPIPEEVLRAAREACDEVGAALIFDEVQTGMGRTGTLWAFQGTGVVPDAMTLAKGLGGGLPIGALVTGPRLADTLQAGDHGSTFAGSPLVAAAAAAALDVVEDPALLASVTELGEHLRAGLAELPRVLQVRGRGLMVGADIDGPAPDVVRRALLDEHLVLNATGPSTLRLLPPLVIDRAQIDDALARLGRVLAAE